MKHFEIYTDGSAKDSWGAWAYLVLHEGKIVAEASGRQRRTNSNRMEFQAAIEALQYLASQGAEPQKFAVTLFTDCKILLDKISNLPECQAAHWRRPNQLPVPNADLFRELYALIQKQAVTWRWVRAHSGNSYNERCDELCRMAREGALVLPALPAIPQTV